MQDFASLKQDIADNAAAVERLADQVLPVTSGDDEDRLFDAMRYAMFSGGKRLRPFLVTASARLFDVVESQALRVALALELLHTYSLVHDDLPAMDDDDLRRGRPTVHRQFDEATAILAGDALLTLAFDVLSDRDTHRNPDVRCELVSKLSQAAGAHGMVGGQMLDMLAEKKSYDLGQITHMQRLKTGALIEYACTAGAILGEAPQAARHALEAYAHDLGLAYQIADDLLDVTGSTETVGKAVGKDASQGKATFVALMGEERARLQGRMLADQAIAHLDVFDERADRLRHLARFVVERDR